MSFKFVLKWTSLLSRLLVPYVFLSVGQSWKPWLSNYPMATSIGDIIDVSSVLFSMLIKCAFCIQSMSNESINFSIGLSNDSTKNWLFSHCSHSANIKYEQAIRCCINGSVSLALISPKWWQIEIVIANWIAN